MTYAPFNAKTAFLSTSEVYPQDSGQLLIKLTDLHTSVANAVNVREISLYQDQQECLTGQQWSIPGDNNKKKLTFRKAFYFGTINAGATLNIPHGITDLVECTTFKGACVTNVVDYRPIPYSDVTAVTNNISINVTGGVGGNVIIQNGATAPNITSGKVTVEYFRN